MRRAIRVAATVGAVLVLASVAGGVAAATDVGGQATDGSPAGTDELGAPTTSVAADSADENGTITFNVRHDGIIPFTDGDRATEVNALVIHQDGDTGEAFRTISDRHWNASEQRLVDVPKTIELPAGHDYHVSVYINDQFAGDTEWISLEAGESVERNLTVENYVPITPQVYHSDGSTAINNATVQVWSHEKQQNDSDGADPVVWRSGETNYDGEVKVPNEDGKLYLYPTEASDPGYYVVEVKKDGEEIAQRRIDDLTAASTEQITTNRSYSVTIVGYDPQTRTYDNATFTSFDATTPASSPSLPEDTSLAQYSPPGASYDKENNSAVPGRTEEYPWSAVGALGIDARFFSDPLPLCTATVLEDNTVVTAAHCVYRRGTWNRWIDPAASHYTVFMPGRSLSSTPLGSVNVSYVQIYERYAEQEITSYDVAVLTLNESIEERTGTFGYESNPAGSQRYTGSLHITGYPSDDDASYVQHNYEQWDLIADGEDTDAGAVEPCRDLCHDYSTGGLLDEATANGTSGASVWRLDTDDLPSTVSVHSSTAGRLLNVTSLNYTKALMDGVGVRISERKASDLARMIERGDEMTVEVSPSQVNVGEDAILRVTVTDPRTGEGIEGASVSLSGVTNVEGQTDADGFVAFAVEPSGSGEIEVTASAPGYENETATVVVGSGATPNATDVFANTTPGESVTATFDATTTTGASLSYAVETAPAGGSVSVDGDQFTYAPESGFEGVDSFTYSASLSGESDTATAYVSVRPDGAAVVDGVVRDPSGEPIDGATVRVPLSGTDATTTTGADGAFSLDLRDREHPSEVTVFVEATGYQTVTRVVSPSDPGLLATELTPTSESVIQLSSTLHHLGDGSYTGTINSQFQEAVEGSTFTTTFDLTSAQANPESAELVYTARGVQLNDPMYVNGERVGTMDETADDGSLSERQLSLSPSSLSEGENTLRIEAEDNFVGDLDDFELSSIRLRIETAGTVQEPPMARNLTVTTERGTEVAGRFNATDPNADIESYDVETAPEHGSVTAVGGSFEYKPDAGFAGTDSFTYRVTDTAGNTDTATVRVVVEGATVPDFRVTALTTPTTATVGESVTVTATVTNTGLVAGTQTVDLTFDGSVAASRDLSLASGETGILATSVSADSLGTVPVAARTENDSRSTTVEFVNKDFVCGSSTGDPHFHTFDGTEYDFQGAGEFVLAHSNGEREFEIQARHVPVGDAVSSTTAIATAIDGTRVTIDATDETPLSVGGTTRSLADGERLAVGDGIVRRDGDTYTAVFPGPDDRVNGTDERLSATLWTDRLDVEVCLDGDRDSSVEGLLGDLDSDQSDDIALADGSTLADPPSYEALYGQFRSDWRVTADTSLFDYDAGESADTFYRPAFPDRQVTVDDLDPAARDRAERRARDAGLEPGTPAFRNAVLDFALTNETDYLASATTTTTPTTGIGGGGVRATARDLTGDGSRDIRLSNGEVFFQINGENVSGGPRVADVAGRVGVGQVPGKLDALPTSPYSSTEQDRPTFEETIAYEVTADAGTYASYRVLREYSYEHTGSRVRIGWTLTLYDDGRYGVANLTVTNVGSGPVELDQDDGNIHDGIQVFDRLGLVGRSESDSGYRFALGDDDPRSFVAAGQWSTFAGTEAGTIYDAADATTVGYLNGTTPPHQWITEGDGGIGYHTDEVTLDPGATASWQVAVAMHAGGSDAPSTGRTIVDRAKRRVTGPAPRSETALSFENGTAGSSTLPSPWTVAKGEGAHSISDDRATDGAKSLYLTGNSGLGQSWATVDVDLTDVATIRGDIYVASGNVFAGDIKVHVDNTSGSIIGVTDRIEGQWYTDLEGDVSGYDGVHTLILRTRGEDNRAHFDNVRFYDAAGNRLDPSSVVVSGAGDALDPTRSLPATVAPGGQAAVTLGANASDSTVTFAETFDPAVENATVDRVSVEGLGSVTPVIANADRNGVVVTLDGLSAGARVTVEYTVSIPDSVTEGTVYAVGGNVSSGTTRSTGSDDLTVRESAFDGAAARYNADGNDVIDITELGAAASDYATGGLTIVELGDVAAAYAAS